MAEIRINTTGGLKLYDADNSHYAQIVAGTITSNVDAITLGHDTVTIADNLSLGSDSAILKFGADTEIALTHVADTGLKLTDSGGTPTLQLHDANESIASDGSKVIITSGGTAFSLPTSDGSNGQVLTTNGSGVLSFATASSADPSSADGDSLGTASAEWSDLYLADGGIVYFGNDQDIRLTHNADKGLIIKHSATADDKPVILTLQTGETDMAADDVIGKIEFQAPDEGTGTDAVLVSAAVQAVAEGDHSSSSNATRLEFMTGASEAATTQMSISSGGIVGIGAVPTGDLGVGLHIKSADSGASASANSDELVIEGGSSDNTGISILSDTDGTGQINFGDSGDNDAGRVYYNHNNDDMRLYTNGEIGLKIDSGGHVTKPLNTAFRVYQSSATDYANGHTMYNQNITEVYDVNSDIASNGTFTAPVTGKYLVSVSAYDAAASENTTYDMILTTSNRTYRWGNRMEYRDNYTGYTNAKMEGTLIVDMDASDTCTVTCGSSATITNASNSEHSYFSAILIG